jgi:L-ascorbate metabolism protein UlaG (beta-lactamase superfamily)
MIGVALRSSTLVGAALATSGCLSVPSGRPQVTSYQPLRSQSGPVQPARLTARFLGTTTLLLSDGRTNIMTDGFFSRPSLGRLLLRPVTPNEGRIRSALNDAQVSRIAAILVAHSHHDHAMDAPYVAQLTGAEIVGSQSTANIALGAGFDERRIRVVGDGWACRFGAFTVTLIKTPHSSPIISPGRIRRPLPRSAWVEDYREGGNFSFHVAHPFGNVLIVPSRGVRHGRLMPAADTVFLGVGGRLPNQQRLRPYWNQFVVEPRAKRVFPIHWDNFLEKLRRADGAELPKRLADTLVTLRSLAAQDVAVESLRYAEQVVVGANPRGVEPVPGPGGDGCVPAMGGRSAVAARAQSSTG